MRCVLTNIVQGRSLFVGVRPRTCWRWQNPVHVHAGMPSVLPFADDAHEGWLGDAQLGRTVR